MARTFFPGESPIGLRYGFWQEHSGDFEVVGVIRDAKYREPSGKSQADGVLSIYAAAWYLGDFTVRYSGDPRGLAQEIRRAFAAVNNNLPITDVRTLAEQVDDTLIADKLVARLSSFFGLLALLLASIGIYGVLSYAVAGRTSEVGLRMALGAKRSNVVWLVMRDVLVLVVIGLAIGVPGAISLERLASGMFYGLAAVDAVTIAAAVSILALVAGVAAYLPARKASLVDPMTALRYE